MHRLVIVTGASRGIGAEIAIEASRRFKDRTVFLLIARNEPLLHQTKQAIISNNHDPDSVQTLKMDFSSDADVDQYTQQIKTSLANRKWAELHELYVFYNHGTLKLGSVEQVANDALDEFRTNVSSVWLFVAAIRRVFPIELIANQFHVNISSLMASQTTSSMSIYCATRAARASLFRSLAIEQPELRVLNYQPGPVYTDMSKQIYDERLQIYETYFSDYEEGKMLSPQKTVTRMFDIIQKNKFESGETIDFFDKN